MTFLQSKYLFFLLLVVFACKKSEIIEENSNEFDGSGKTITYYPFGDSTFRPAVLTIPAGAVNRIHYCEHNSIYIDAAFPLDSFEVNFLVNDIHEFQSSSDSLLIPATLEIPFKQTITFSLTSGYKPYKIKLSSTSGVYDQINDASRWTEISAFTFDNTAKTITFEIDDLNACYVIAKHL